MCNRHATWENMCKHICSVKVRMLVKRHWERLPMKNWRNFPCLFTGPQRSSVHTQRTLNILAGLRQQWHTRREGGTSPVALRKKPEAPPEMSLLPQSYAQFHSGPHLITSSRCSIYLAPPQITYVLYHWKGQRQAEDSKQEFYISRR